MFDNSPEPAWKDEYAKWSTVKKKKKTITCRSVGTFPPEFVVRAVSSSSGLALSAASLLYSQMLLHIIYKVTNIYISH